MLIIQLPKPYVNTYYRYHLSTTAGTILSAKSGTISALSSPTFNLPYQTRIEAKYILISGGHPYMILTDYPNAYGEARVSKLFGKHFNCFVEGHDLFYNKMRACIAGVQYRF